jgi:DNA-binding transcriptional ArsR family regulator
MDIEEPDEQHQLPFQNERELDLVSLKALAHPLRVQIIDALSVYGTQTASGLAERLGESSGATSYHLRQLEKHGFVGEVEGKGSGRERWWQRSPGAINIGSKASNESIAGKAAASTIWRQFHYTQDRLLTEFVENGTEVLGEKWANTAAVSVTNARLTRDQLRDFVRDYERLMEKYLLPNKNQTAPGSRPVQVQFNAFPVLDGDAIADPEVRPDNVGGSQ